MDVCIEWGQTLGLKVTVKGFIPQINVAKAAEHKRTFIQYSVPTNVVDIRASGSNLGKTWSQKQKQKHQHISIR